MIKGKVKRLGMFTAGAALALTAQQSFGISPFGYTEGFENDADEFEPTNPDVTTTPPFTATGYPGVLPGDTTAGAEDWFDNRNVTANYGNNTQADGGGLIEEVASNDPNFFNITSPSGNAHAVVYRGPDAVAQTPYGPFVFQDGPFGRLGRQQLNPGPGGAGPQYAFHVDIFALEDTEPSAGIGGGGLGNGSNGTPDIWWTNAVNGNVTNSYITETGFAVEVINDGVGNHFWHLTTTAGTPVADVPVGEWYTLEVVYDTTNTNLSAIHNVYDIGHTTLLGSYTLTSMFQNPLSSSLGGPRYTWLSQGDNGVSAFDDTGLFIDNIGTGAPIVIPEPASMALLAFGAAGVLRRRRA